jgi:hypothetical protein
MKDRMPLKFADEVHIRIFRWAPEDKKERYKLARQLKRALEKSLAAFEEAASLNLPEHYQIEVDYNGSVRVVTRDSITVSAIDNVRRQILKRKLGLPTDISQAERRSLNSGKEKLGRNVEPLT